MLSCLPTPGLGVLPWVTSQVKVFCDSLVFPRDVLPRDQRALPSELRVCGKDQAPWSLAAVAAARLKPQLCPHF